jgi:hypothetical protein
MILSLLFVVLLIDQCQYVSGFAAWLKCYVDITDTEEIVMNYHILPSSEAVHEGVQIEVKGVDDDHWVTDNFMYDPTRTLKIMARLQVPPSLSEMDVQYVMEIIPLDDEEPKSATENENVKFVRPADVCKGRRGHATHHTESVVLEIQATTAVTIPTAVRLVAGYATGHEAVTLTEPIILQPIDTEEEL